MNQCALEAVGAFYKAKPCKTWITNDKTRTTLEIAQGLILKETLKEQNEKLLDGYK